MRIKAKKLMQKNYNLVNVKTGEKIVVHPPGLPGVNADGKNPKNAAKRWIRMFTIVDANGVAAFAGQSTIELTHAPKELPSVEINGETWNVVSMEKTETAPAAVAATAAP